MKLNGRFYHLTEKESKTFLLNDLRPDEETVRRRDEFFREIDETVLNLQRDAGGRITANAVRLDEERILQLYESSLNKPTQKEDICAGDKSVVVYTVSLCTNNKAIPHCKDVENRPAYEVGRTKTFFNLCNVVCIIQNEVLAVKKASNYARSERIFSEKGRVFA